MKHTLLFIVIAASLLTGCKKDKQPVPAQANSPKLLDKMSWTLSSGVADYLDYEYDAQGRNIKTEDIESTVLATYNGNTVLFKETSKAAGARVLADLTAQLDDKGRLTTGSGWTEYSPGDKLNISFNHVYNSEGFLEKYTESRSDGTERRFEYTYVDGNKTKFRAYNNGVLSFGTDFEYSSAPDKIASSNHYALGFAVNGLDGKPNKNMVTVQRGINSNNQVSYTNNFAYEFDSEGYPVKRTTTGSTSLVVFYTYTK